jgi:hypothetical protein
MRGRTQNSSTNSESANKVLSDGVVHRASRSARVSCGHPRLSVRVSFQASKNSLSGVFMADIFLVHEPYDLSHII